MPLAAWPLAALLLASPSALPPVPADTLRVFLVRHGQAFSNLDPLPELPPAQLDRLTDLGRAQARAAGRALRGLGIRLVLSSPKGRARETAEEIRAALEEGVLVRVEERLRSLELGRDAAGRALPWDARLAHWKRGQDPAPDGGESLERLGLRVLEALSDLKAERLGASVVVVSHSEVIGNLLGMLEGLALDARFEVKIGNGSITALDARAASLPRLLFRNFLPEAKEAAEARDARAPRPAARRLAAP